MIVVLNLSNEFCLFFFFMILVEVAVSTKVMTWIEVDLFIDLNIFFFTSVISNLNYFEM